VGPLALVKRRWADRRCYRDHHHQIGQVQDRVLAPCELGPVITASRQLAHVPPSGLGDVDRPRACKPKPEYQESIGNRVNQYDYGPGEGGPQRFQSGLWADQSGVAVSRGRRCRC